MGGLATGEYAQVVATVQPLLERLVELPTPSIMASGFVVTYTEAAVRAGASPSDQVAAVRHLGPVLQGDFNRLGLAFARLVQQRGHHELAARAVGACSRVGRSTFSSEQIDAIVTRAGSEVGASRVEELIAEGAESERSDLYRAMWDQLPPAFTQP